MERTMLFVAAATIAVATTRPAAATTVVEMPLEQLADEAHAIVHGVVESSASRVILDGSSWRVVSVTRLRVRAWIKNAGGPIVEIEERGGSFAGGEEWVIGTPSYRAGEELVVFLERAPSGVLRTLGLAQGRFEVIPGVGRAPSTVQRELGALGLVSWRDGQMVISHGHEPPADLESFLAFLRARVAPVMSSTDDPRVAR